MKDNKGFTLVEVMVSLIIISLMMMTLTIVNNNMLDMYKIGLVNGSEIRDLASSAEGVFTTELQESVEQTTKKDLDYMLKIDASNTTFSTYLEPNVDFSYTGSGMYMRYMVQHFKTKDDIAILGPYYLERYDSYE